MNIKLVTRVVSSLSIVIGFAMMSSVPVSIYMEDPKIVSYKLFLCSLTVILISSIVRFLVKRSTVVDFGFREGFGIVTFGWIFAAIFGALPFVVICNFHFYDAFFETMSGFTTTGASIIDDQLLLYTGNKLKYGLLDIPNGILYWRALTNWLGGMGIVVLSLAILPTLGISPHQLYNAEVPGPVEDQITPRIATSAKILWGAYVLLSIILAVLLWTSGMSIFDAWCTMCGTMATGGFSTQPASIGAYNSLSIDVIITIFMFLSGTNFALHFRSLQGKSICHFKNEEFRFYTFITIMAILTISFILIGTDIKTTQGIIWEDVGFFTALRYASFQVVTVITATGLTTADFNLWPSYAALLLVFLMFIGGCAGSTSGGMKNSRVLLLFKYAITQVEKKLFVHSISNVRLDKSRVNTLALHRTLSFFFLFVLTFVIFSLVLCCLGVDDIITALSASIACLSNVGPGLAKVGATESYSWMSPSAKLLLSFEMLLGRLELYTVLVLFLPAFWKR